MLAEALCRAYVRGWYDGLDGKSTDANKVTVAAELQAEFPVLAAAPKLLHELGAIGDALAEGQTVRIEPGSVKAERIRAALANAETK